MATKSSSKAKTPKTNVARTSGKSAALTKRNKFSWKLAAVVGIVLVVALGYLYVRLSEAATAPKTWYAESFISFGSNNPGLTDTYPGTFPAKAWYGWEAGFRIPHSNLGAGRYCFAAANVGRGGGSPLISTKVYGLSGSNKTLVASSTNNQACVSVPADTSTYPNREYEFFVTGGTAAIGSVVFTPTSTNPGIKSPTPTPTTTSVSPTSTTTPGVKTPTPTTTTTTTVTPSSPASTSCGQNGTKC